MLRLILLYASSTGLQRGIVFLATPLLAASLGLADLGVYTLVQTASQLIIPLFTWNCTVALTREALDHPAQTRTLLNRLALALLTLAILAAPIALLTQHPHWAVFAIALGATEAIFTSAVAVLQGRELVSRVVALSLAKTVVFAGLVLMTASGRMTILLFLKFQFIASAAMSLAAWTVSERLLRGADGVRSPHAVTIASMIKYSAATLPHTAALWLSASSDRLLLGTIKGQSAVGEYALAYTVAQVVMLLMSGVISALPPRVARDAGWWRHEGNVAKFIWMVTAFALAIICACEVFLAVNVHLHAFIPKMPRDAPMLVATIGTGFYASLFYVLFASYMYLNRDTKALAVAGIYIGPLNLIVMAAMVWAFGSKGAAFGLLIAYCSFGIVYGRAAMRMEACLRSVVRHAIYAVTVLLVVALACAFVVGG